MSQTTRATVCVFPGKSEREQNVSRHVGSLLCGVPLQDIELRFCFDSKFSFYQVLGTLSTDGQTPIRHELPGGIDRFHWTGKDGLKIRAWHSPTGLTKEKMARLLFHDVMIETEFTVSIDSDFSAEAGWWDSWLAQTKSDTDYLGRPQWFDYLPHHLDEIRANPWYLGVPFDRREKRLGVWYIPWGFIVIRSRRLRESNFPEFTAARRVGPLRCNEDVLLGEMARQLGWNRVNYDRAIQADDNIT